jgi:hypothetical protein
MVEAASTSETSVNFYQTTRRTTPEGSHLHTHRRENLKSHLGNEVHPYVVTATLSSVAISRSCSKQQTLYPKECGVKIARAGSVSLRMTCHVFRIVN